MKTKIDVVQPEGNYYDKYHSSNPIVKWMMANFKKSIKELLEILEKEPSKICETGCGEGQSPYRCIWYIGEGDFECNGTAW